jgi:heptaprenyl diphosphate synthase
MSQASVPHDLLPDLERVDQIISERIAARPVVAGIAGQYLSSKEDRLLAAVVLLASRLGSAAPGAAAPDSVAHAAASAELIHAATGVHDALVDEAERRRGAVASNSRWGGNAALMVGDYLLALAAAEMALAPDQRIIEFYSRSVMEVCEGQLAPVTDAAPLAVAREQYMYRAGCLAGAPLEAAASAGGVCAGLPGEQIAALGRFGRELGLALRIAADAQDYERAGAALRAGRITLPLIYAADAGATGLLRLLDAPPDARELADALAEVRRAGGVERALADARRLAETAAGQLESLLPGPALAALRELCAGIPRRERGS